MSKKTDIPSIIRGYWYHQRGEEFRVDAQGRISRPSIGMAAIDQWIVRGAVRFNNFGHQVEFVPFPQCFDQPRQWLHKNRKGRWFIADLDHGTRRVQMTPVLGAGVL